MESEWAGHLERERRRYEDGVARLPGIDGADERQRQLTRMGNAAVGAALALVMADRPDEASVWFERAANHYRESFDDAPPESWGRPIGALKARVLGGDWEGAAADALWALDQIATEVESPIGRYAACLALLVLGEDEAALGIAVTLQSSDHFPSPVAGALAAVAQHDRGAYVGSIGEALASFEERDRYLEDVPVADTVMVFQALARRRSLHVKLRSPLLPTDRMLAVE
jgi:hypothetical protein